MLYADETNGSEGRHSSNIVRLLDSFCFLPGTFLTDSRCAGSRMKKEKVIPDLALCIQGFSPEKARDLP
jgi:hypothetical protein